MSPEMHITIQIIRQYRMWPKDTPLTFAGGVSRQIDVGGRGVSLILGLLQRLTDALVEAIP